MKAVSALGALLALAESAVASSYGGGCKAPEMASFLDPISGVEYKLAIPAVAEAPFPILLSVSGPKKSTTWAGFATGGGMIADPLVVSWPYADTAVVGTRWATSHTPPSLYNDTEIEVLASSGSNATHWTATSLCKKGCSSWSGGSIDPRSHNATFGFAVSSASITNPSTSAGTIQYHDVNHGTFSVDLTLARNSERNFETLVNAYNTK